MQKQPTPPPNRALALSLATMLRRYGSKRYRFEANVLRDILAPAYAAFIQERRAGISGGPAAQNLLRLIEGWKTQQRAPMPVEPLERRMIAGARTVQRHTERTLKSVGIVTTLQSEDILRQIRLSAFLTANQVNEVFQTRINQAAALASEKVLEGRPLTELMREAGRLAQTMERADMLRARNISGKVTAEVTEDAFRQAGVTHYIWRTQGDSRTRSEHKALEGKKFKVGEGSTTEGRPGDRHGCRCWAEAVGPQAGIPVDI